MPKKLKLLRALLRLLCAIQILKSTYLASGGFILEVNFISYTNPTGLCAECNGGLETVTSADQLTPVCCDESPFRSDNCDNTGEARCDTRFRWTIRPFNASLETRPVSVPGAAVPPYSFTDCNLPGATCPFSEMSTMFSQGPTGFLGVATNPLQVVSPSTLTSWTGRVQFFIEAVDSGLPNIIDSLLIDLDNLQLGADFTEEMTFTGYHNISHMTMSFRVACQNGSCGKDCTATRIKNVQILSCNSTDGDIVCRERYDPSANCNGCLHNLNISTDCSTCLEPYFDPDTNCTACLPGYNRNINCTTCLINYDPSTNCTACLDTRFDPDNNCTSCLLEGHDPLTNCTQCLPNRDPCTDCSTCLFGFDINRDCSVCLPGRDISTSCTSCLSGYTGENCVPDDMTTDPSPTLSVALMGGVMAVMAIAILVLTVVVILLACSRKRNNKDVSAIKDKEPVEAIQTKQNPVYDVTTAGPPQPSTAHTDAIQLQPNVLYGVSIEPDRGDQTTYYENEGLGQQTNKPNEYDYMQL